jgi:hypothetical protein
MKLDWFYDIQPSSKPSIRVILVIKMHKMWKKSTCSDIEIKSQQK